MKFIIALATGVALSLSALAQNYLVELTPKGYYFPSSSNLGVGLDIGFAVTNGVTFGVCSYIDAGNGDNVTGLNLKFGSNRQKFFSAYGSIKLLYGTYTKEQDGFPDKPISGLGAGFGAGYRMKLARTISWTGEAGYYVGEGIGSSEGGDGFSGIFIETGFIFRMIRRH